MTPGDFPGHAYVPGQTPRHAPGAFDPIRATVHPGLPVEALRTSPAFVTGLGWIGEGYFWEAHEVLEPVWMACPDPGAERELVQALIQIANAGLKRRMGRDKAVARLCDRVADHLSAAFAANDRILGLSRAEAEEILKKAL